MHGWLNLYKPVGMSSARAVAQVKRFLKPKKIGHAGTLDPFAEGVLPLALGEATKLMPYAVATEKTYAYTVVWGEQRTTDDREGEIMEISAHRPTVEEIQEVMPTFVGKISQLPPLYSAIKIQGKRACDRVRAGEAVTLQPRHVDIYDLQLISHSVQESTFRVRCGKGTYVRSLARDMGEVLGCYGYTKRLIREQVGDFSVEKSVSLEKMLESTPTFALEHYMMSPDHVLDDIPAFYLDEIQETKVRHGQVLSLESQVDNSETVALKSSQHDLIGLGKISEGSLYPSRIFNLR